MARLVDWMTQGRSGGDPSAGSRISGRIAMLTHLRRSVVVATRRRASLARNRFFDLRHGVDTLEDGAFEFPSEAAHDDARHYARVSPRVFASLMRDIDVPAGATFIDIGCGKGAALLLALEHGFRAVVGVELNGRLVPIARANVKKFAADRNLDARVEIVQGDAVEFRFPDSPTVLFLFNPFGAETLKEVLDNLESSLRRTPREVVVAYVNPTHASEFAGRSLLRQVPSHAPYCSIYASAAQVD